MRRSRISIHHREGCMRHILLKTSIFSRINLISRGNPSSQPGKNGCRWYNGSSSTHAGICRRRWIRYWPAEPFHFDHPPNPVGR